MKVLKFGGTSVGTIESLTNVKKIVEGLSEQAIVVVSALGGITDKLINTANLAKQGDVSYLNEFEIIVNRHHVVIEGMVQSDLVSETKEIIDRLLSELNDIYKGVALIKELSVRTYDMIVSYGERMSSVIVSNIIKGAKHYNSLDFIKTEKWFNKNIADTKLTDRLIHEHFDNMTAPVAIVPGFISTDRDTGEVTNLGRGGSDYTAAILAAALDAEVLEIWTDVNGFMTADPRIIKNAFVINHLSFVESMDLCNFGAKVIYPPTIYPVFHKNIPIRIRNTFNPETEGTWITDETSDSTYPIKGISSISDTSLITIKGININDEIHSRIFNTMSNNGVSVILISETIDDESISYAVRETESASAIKLLQDEFASEISSNNRIEIYCLNNLATIAAVGENMKHNPGIAARLYNTLKINGINVEAHAKSTSGTNISFVVDAGSTIDALSIIHNNFF